LFKDSTWEACTEDVEGYTLSKTWKPVEGMPKIDEYSVLKDNYVLKYLKGLPKYRVEGWKQFDV